MANQSQLQILKAGVSEWNKWRKQNSTEPVDLSHSDLTGLELKGAKLQGANFENSNLSLIDLSKAKLSGSSFQDANLHQANMSYADLKQVNLKAANLRFANLKGANLENANLSEAIFFKADLSEAKLNKAKLINTSLLGSLAIGTQLKEATLEAVNLDGVFIGAKIGSFGVKIREANAHGTNFVRCDFQLCNFTDSLGIHGKYILVNGKRFPSRGSLKPGELVDKLRSLDGDGGFQVDLDEEPSEVGESFEKIALQFRQETSDLD